MLERKVSLSLLAACLYFSLVQDVEERTLIFFTVVVAVVKFVVVKFFTLILLGFLVFLSCKVSDLLSVVGEREQGSGDLTRMCSSLVSNWTPITLATSKKVVSNQL